MLRSRRVYIAFYWDTSPPEPEPDDDMTPIGGIYLSIASTDPGLPVVSGGLGYGTWARIGHGRVLVGVDENDTDFDAPELQIGTKTVTPTGSVSAPTFTGDALGAHSHGAGTLAASAPTFTGASFSSVINHTHAVNVTDGGHNHTQDAHNHTQNAHQHGLAEGQTDGAGTFVDRSSAASAAASVTDNATAVNQAATATNQSATTGISATTSNPAGGVASITPAGTNSAPAISGSTASVSAGTPAGTNSAPTFSGAASSVVQPSLTVFMWARTA